MSSLYNLYDGGLWEGMLQQWFPREIPRIPMRITQLKTRNFEQVC